MKHLIKQYSHFFGEIIRLKKVFPNSLNCLFPLRDLIHFRSFTEFIYHKAQANGKVIPVGFFLIQKLKN